MKNSAIKAMIATQFNWICLDDIGVEFIAVVQGKEEYKIYFIDEGIYREFALSIEFNEVAK